MGHSSDSIDDGGGLAVREGHGDISYEDISQGCIIFLKRRCDISAELLASSGIDEEGLHHPVLIVQKLTLQADHVLVCPVGESRL